MSNENTTSKDLSAPLKSTKARLLSRVNYPVTLKLKEGEGTTCIQVPPSGNVPIDDFNLLVSYNPREITLVKEDQS